MKQQELYIVDLRHVTRPIYHSVFYINVTKKQTWAALARGDSYQNKHLLGSSAFYTRAAAERAKYAVLKRALKYLPSHFYWKSRSIAEEQVKFYEIHGHF